MANTCWIKKFSTRLLQKVGVIDGWSICLYVTNMGNTCWIKSASTWLLQEVHVWFVAWSTCVSATKTENLCWSKSALPRLLQKVHAICCLVRMSVCHKYRESMLNKKCSMKALSLTEGVCNLLVGLYVSMSRLMKSKSFEQSYKLWNCYIDDWRSTMSSFNDWQSLDTIM